MDSLSECVGGGESKQELDLERDPFFELEAWFTPEQSLVRPLESPTEEELAARLHTAPRLLWELVCQGILTEIAYGQIMEENGMTYRLPLEAPPLEAKEVSQGGRTHSPHGHPSSIGSAGQLSIIGFHVPDNPGIRALSW